MEHPIKVETVALVAVARKMAVTAALTEEEAALAVHRIKKPVMAAHTEAAEVLLDTQVKRLVPVELMEETVVTQANQEKTEVLFSTLL